MRHQHSNLQIALYLIGGFILLAGLLGAAMVYLTAVEERSDVVGYEIADGEVYGVSASESKRYRHDLELFGGKAAVLADDFSRWFAGLWQGRRLAYTLAVLAIGLALGCFRAAHRLSRGPNGDPHG